MENYSAMRISDLEIPIALLNLSPRRFTIEFFDCVRAKVNPGSRFSFKLNRGGGEVGWFER